MARHKKHEEHLNHEAWAIPYGDLVTLLLALFVVMYAVSSINEGKFRVLSEAMSVAFGGPPRTMHPIQLGETQTKGAEVKADRTLLPTPRISPSFGVLRDLHNRQALPGIVQTQVKQHDNNLSGSTGYADGYKTIRRIAAEVESAMKTLIDDGQITIRSGETWLEVEIKTDILFASGLADVSPAAVPTLSRLVNVLKPFPNALRIEGHTDNRPINTRIFPSNWELSSARAASVVHLFMQQGIDPLRLSVQGYGEFRPVGDNQTVEGRNRNRRVVIVVLAGPQDDRVLKINHQAPVTLNPQPLQLAQQRVSDIQEARP